MESTVANDVLKGGEFVIKDSQVEDIFTPEEINEEQRMVKQMCQEFVADMGARAQKMEHQVALAEQAGELGLLGSHIPEAYGGMEMDTNTNTVIAEQMGYSGGSFTTTFAAHTGIGMLPILYFGTEEQKLKYLPGLSSGQLKASYCLTEPSSGSDALSAKTKAILTEDGKHYVLNGQKMWITNAGFADVFIVFAQVDGDKFTGFIIERGTEGMTLGAEEDKMGIKGSSTRQVFLENVKVPVENLLGEIGKGHLIAFNVLNIGRFKLGSIALGGCKLGVDEGIKYANERIQFKVPISKFGAIQFKIAESTIKSFALECVSYRISNFLQLKKEALVAEGETYSDAMLKAAEEYSIECALLKVLGSEVLDYVVDETVQIHGGNGFSEEFRAAGAYRDSRINRIYEGTNEINRLLMVNMLLRKAMKGQLDLTGPAWAVQKELASMPSMEMPEGDYAAEKKALKDFKKMLLMTAGAAVKAQMDGQVNLKHEQEIIMNVADLMIDVFTVESLLLRVEKLKGMDKEVDQAVYDAILKVYIHDATTRMAKNATDALASFAEGDVLRILLMGVKRYSKYTPVNVKKYRRVIADAGITKNGYPL